MPDRFLNPKLATYLLIGLAVAVIVLGGLYLKLNDKVERQETLHQLELRATEARRQLGCALFVTFVRLNDINAEALTGESLRDYQLARDSLEPSLAACVAVPSGPSGLLGPTGKP